MKNLYLAVIFLTVTTVNAQIGIGTSTIDASAKLQVDATNKGFLQPRVALTGTADTATIATPATGLMVFNTATAGTGATAVTPGVYYYSGSAWQRLANQADVAAATATATYVIGNLGTAWDGAAPISYDPQLGIGAKNFGASITLPPGKWEVGLDISAIISDNGIPSGVKLMNYWLVETQSNSDSFNYGSIPSPTDITTDTFVNGGAFFTRPLGLDINHKGNFYINNSTSSNKTYYLLFLETAPYDNCPYQDCIVFYYKSFGGTTWKGNRFYAVKVN